MSRFRFSAKENAKQEMNDYINILFTEVQKEKVTEEERVNNTLLLTEAYFEVMGEHAPANMLDRLATYLMYEYTVDMNPHKIKEENAFQTESQEKYMRRHVFLQPELSYSQEHYTDGKVSKKFGVELETYSVTFSERFQKIFKKEVDETIQADNRIITEDILSSNFLTEFEKVVLKLYFLEDKTFLEIAKTLEKGKTTVYDAYRNSLKKIKKFQLKAPDL